MYLYIKYLVEPYETAIFIGENQQFHMIQPNNKPSD